jgi:cell division protein YceG involved in septum cleavage
LKKESCFYILSFIIVVIAITGALTFTGNQSKLEDYHQVEIKEGDSLWSIAEKFQDNTQISKQEFVKWVQDKNDIHSTIIKPGDLVFVPVEKEELFQLEQVASE